MTRKRPPCPPLTCTPEKKAQIEAWKFQRYGMPPNPEGDKADAEYWSKLFPRMEWMKVNDTDSAA